MQDSLDAVRLRAAGACTRSWRQARRVQRYVPQGGRVHGTASHGRAPRTAQPLHPCVRWSSHGGQGRGSEAGRSGRKPPRSRCSRADMSGKPSKRAAGTKRRQVRGASPWAQNFLCVNAVATARWRCTRTHAACLLPLCERHTGGGASAVAPLRSCPPVATTPAGVLRRNSLCCHSSTLGSGRRRFTPRRARTRCVRAPPCGASEVPRARGASEAATTLKCGGPLSRATTHRSSSLPPQSAWPPQHAPRA